MLEAPDKLDLLALSQILLPRHALERLAGGLDAVEEMSVFRR
jgi:hypothetical protein